MLVPTLLAGPVSDAMTPTLIIAGAAEAVCCCVQPAINATAISIIAMKRTEYFILIPTMLCYSISLYNTPFEIKKNSGLYIFFTKFFLPDRAPSKILSAFIFA
jgi:hypothetical protein